MSSEGVTLVIRVLLVVVSIIVATILGHLVGPGRKRGRIMLAGTLGGISFGVLVAYPISYWLKTDASAICAFLGMQIGWGLSWLSARQIPREAN
jgi:hypothetical protein